MGRPPTSDDSPDVTSPEEFQCRLDALVASASENGVDVAGGWTCDPDASDGTWDVVITPVDPGE